MNGGGAELWKALISAGYPSPVVVDEPGQLTLSWDVGVGVREMCVSSSGVVTVWVARTPDAVFALGPSRQSAADWVSLLHPLIAEPIARSSGSLTRVREPATVVARSAAVVWLEHDADSATTYAVYSDTARIWVSTRDGPETAAALSGTDRGLQLGITSDTLTAIPSAYSGTVMINPRLAAAAALEARGRWSPAVAFRSGRAALHRGGGLDDQSRAIRSSLPGSLPRTCAPTIRLKADECSTYDDAIAVSEALLCAARTTNNVAAQGN